MQDEQVPLSAPILSYQLSYRVPSVERKELKVDYNCMMSLHVLFFLPWKMLLLKRGLQAPLGTSHWLACPTQRERERELITLLHLLIV